MHNMYMYYYMYVYRLLLFMYSSNFVQQFLKDYYFTVISLIMYDNNKYMLIIYITLHNGKSHDIQDHMRTNNKVSNIDCTHDLLHCLWKYNLSVCLLLCR